MRPALSRSPRTRASCISCSMSSIGRDRRPAVRRRTEASCCRACGNYRAPGESLAALPSAKPVMLGANSYLAMELANHGTDYREQNIDCRTGSLANPVAVVPENWLTQPTLLLDMIVKLNQSKLLPK